MIALHKLASTTVAAALVFAATPARAQLKPSSPQAIAAAVVDCWQATNALALDEAALTAKGWQAAPLRSADGKPVASPLTFLSRKDSHVVVLISKAVDPRGCVITSRVESIESITLAAREIYKLVQPLEPKLELKQPTPAEVAYFAFPKAALLRATGNRDKPGVTIQVSYTAAEKK